MPIAQTVCACLLLMSGLAACAREDSCDFMLQHEIDRMLIDLDASPWPKRARFVSHVDYAAKGGWVPFDYLCPICGTRTHYPEKTLFLPIQGDGYAAFLADVRHTVEFLRARRLNVHVDERILCSSCRVALGVPDSGEIVAVPKKWPPRYWHLDPSRTNFPFRVGDKVRICAERNMWGRRCYQVVKEAATYWISAKDVSPDGKITAQGIDCWVRFGPGGSYPSISFLNRWCEPERGLPLLETETNGWIRLNVANEELYYAYVVPTDCVGRLESSGSAFCRRDLFERLKWAINGREIDIEPDDCLLLRTFFSGQRDIPGRTANATLKSSRNRSRLGELLSPGLSPLPFDRRTNPVQSLEESEISVENF